MRPRPGQLVQVRSRDEILATLDSEGRLDGLPFMPEMLQYCGRSFRVYRRIEKIFDYIDRTGNRRMRDTVALDELRCDGSGHAGCQSGCLLMWKEAWLRPANGAHSPASATDSSREGAEILERATHRSDGTYTCQLIEQAAASEPMAVWDLRQDLRELWSGNVGVREFVATSLVVLFNWVQSLRGGAHYPAIEPRAIQQRTPLEKLELQPGEWIEIKSAEEIEATLDARGRNRGLWFDRELLEFCGQRFRVARRVDHVIDERSGRMVELRTPCVILDGATAQGRYRRFCQQHENVFWREVWLRRVADNCESARGE